MKKIFVTLSLVLAVGIFLLTCQTGKAKANTDTIFDENVYAIEESCLSSGIKLEEQEESLAIHTVEKVDNICEAGLTINEWGYTYSAGKGNGSIIEKEISNNVQNKESMNKGEEKEISEMILSWNEAQDYFGYDRLCWLNNEYLSSCAEDISFIVSDDDIAIVEYSMQTSKVKIYVFTVHEQGNKCFEFGRNYSSELYDIRQIEVNSIWQCFSYKGCDGTEYTSAVLPDNNMVCEIVFEKCDEQLIYNALASYE